MNKYSPPLIFKNPHLNAIVASTKPRKLLLRRRAKRLLQSSETHLLDCGDGVRLLGKYSHNSENTKGLVILIAGWLGNDDSNYILSSASTLYHSGFNIFRLNLRDHGKSSQLNKELFNANRIDEVINACRQIQQQFPHQYCYLAGFSLGGNFSLRVATVGKEHGIQLDKVVAICPVIDPPKSNNNVKDGPLLYRYYFQRKWQHALWEKLKHFPEHDYAEMLKNAKTMDDMNQYFVPNHTDFSHPDEYFGSYALGGTYFADLETPCHIITSEDDPVIDAEDLAQLHDNPKLSIELTRYGGHCGYLDSIKMTSWIDTRLAQIFLKKTI